LIFEKSFASGFDSVWDVYISGFCIIAELKQRKRHGTQRLKQLPSLSVSFQLDYMARLPPG